MRAFCTVSAPLEVCASSAEQLSPGSRFLALRLLGNQQPKTLYFLVDAKSRVREVYTQTCLHFATHGMLDTELFGLAVLIDGEYMFADPESKLSKYGPKSWRSSHTHGLDANGRPLLELHFRVQFYIESPVLLKDETSRHNYYLQLKYNTLQRDIPREYSEQSMILLAGLALQADLGDAPASTIAGGGGSTTAFAAAGDDGGSVGSDETSPTSIASTILARAGNMKPSSTTTTTLPKINKRSSSSSTTANTERVLRLSTYASGAPTTILAAPSVKPPASTTSTSVFPISGSLKRGLGAVAATLSPSTSTLSINRSVKSVTPTATTSTSLSSSSSANTNPLAAADYFRLDDYLPLGLRTAWAVSALRACHRENRGMSTADAELHYIQQACVVHESINAHTFRMRLTKGEHGPGNSWFVVYAKGIKIFGVGDNPQQQITFLWPNITKLSFERKKFEIRSGDSKITLYATTDEKNKMLLTLCKETHQFSMKIAARLKEVIKREEEESNCLHDCYIYSRSLHLPYKNKSDQRISVISSTSSNTTSGIVSDRVHSEDELEIMINTPPAPIAAPSTESLALAHLLDRPSVSRQTSSVGQVSMKELEEQLAALTVRQAQQKQRSNSGGGGESLADLSHSSSGNNSSSSATSNPPSSQHTEDSSTTTTTTTTTDSPNSQHNIGSQCSSTCSTVVVAASVTESGSNPLTSLSVVVHAANANPMQRRNSTSSSLELGFSHTAQNSTLSEAESTCISHDFTPSVRDETESVSGVYTLAHGAPPTETSGVYTMHSSELTGRSSEIAESEKSSHYGIFQPAKSELSDDHLRDEHANLDLVDGGNYHGKRIKNEEFRLRSDSNVSTSGSFRGDGSDPTDIKHTLLSAEELTDLIVGRGTYPNRKTVSSTLDTDCDYVTLPLPMAGESYIQGHQDTAPTDEDHVADLISDLLPTDPPAPPQRIDSNGLGHHNNLASLSNIRMRSPPPYNARHEKTGLCGPPVRSVMPNKAAVAIPPPPPPVAPIPAPAVAPVQATVSKVPSPPKVAEAKLISKAVAAAVVVAPPLPPPAAPTAIRRRDPPPYPTSSKPRPTSLISVTSSNTSSTAGNALYNAAAGGIAGGSMTSLKSEEVTARFITTRPQISILKAHTSIVNDNPPKPSYAAPTTCSSAASSLGSVSGHHHVPPHHHLSQHSVHNANYISGSQASLSLSHSVSQSSLSAAAVAHAAAAAAAGAGVIPSTIGIPIVPYSLHGASHKSTLSQQQHAPPPTPYSEMKPSPRTCVLLPVIKPRQFLPPPPPSLPRQPPPPPPPQLAGVYTSQLARKQLELYQQQLYSDVDYVIYPIQDPAVSQQEYLDAKQGSILAAMAQSQAPPPHPYLTAYHTAGGWDTCKGHAIYRSTPYLPLALSTHSRYASTQNLSDTYVQLPSAYSPLYSPSMASLCSSYEPPPPPAPLHPAALAAAAAANSSNLFAARSRSDDNILNSLDSLPKMKRMPPPPPPPPYVNRHLKKPPMPTPTEKPPPIPSKPPPPQTLSNNNHQQQHHHHHHHHQHHHSVMRSNHLPPRKPPTLNSSSSHMTKTSSGAQWAGERPKPDLGLGKGSTSILAHLQASMAAANRQAARTNPMAQSSAVAAAAPPSPPTPMTATNGAATPNALDIALLREKSKNLDLPLISALCNDRSLLKQTKLHVNPKHSRNSSAVTPSPSAGSTTSSSGSATPPTTTATGSPVAAAMPISGGQSAHIASKSMAAVIPSSSVTPSTANMNGASAVAAAVAAKQAAAAAGGKPRKTSISHRHPNDKLPPLPMQLAEANNYVMDPAILKHHKNYNTQT